MKKPYRVLVLFSLALGLTACQLPTVSNLIIQPTADMTQAYASAAAHLTQTPPATASPAPATATATPPSTRAPESDLTPRPGATRPEPTATAICNRAAPGIPIDVTIPDDTVLAPEQEFTKTWRLVNAGSCAWSRQYTALFFYGEQMQAPIGLQLAGDVWPGQSVDISVDMVAPQQEGTFQSNWMLAAPDGRLFGIGPDGSAPFWVRIQVAQVNTPAPVSQPTATATPTQVVYAGGLANLQPGSNLDLDSNTPGDAGSADLAYSPDGDDPRRLTPLNGARLGIFGLATPSYNDCLSTILSTDPLALAGVTQGTFYCTRTNDGLPGWVRVVALNEVDGALTLELMTWLIP